METEIGILQKCNFLYPKFANGKVEGEVAINFRGQRTPDLSIFEDLRKGEAGYVLFGTCGHRSVFLEMAGNGEEERKTAGKFFQNENKH